MPPCRPCYPPGRPRPFPGLVRDIGVSDLADIFSGSMTRRYQLRPAAGAPRAFDAAGQLNDEQRVVVEAPDGPLLVIAGAGSGKTRTLTWRVARLLHDGLDPESLLLLTFTNKAAREMLGRVDDVARIDTAGSGAARFITWPIACFASTRRCSATRRATPSSTGRTGAT